MKHSLDLFEQPVPVLRAPEADDAGRIADLADGFASGEAYAPQGDLMSNAAFRDTSVVAELEGELVGGVTAYRLPYDPQTLFIWHADVAETARDQGLSSLMMGYLMRQEACVGVTRVQTAIAPMDERAWTLFRHFARWQRSHMEIQMFITQALTPFAQHETDHLVTILLQDARLVEPDQIPTVVPIAHTPAQANPI